MPIINDDPTLPNSTLLILDKTKITDMFFKEQRLNDIIDDETTRLKDKQTDIEIAMQSQMRLVDLESSYAKRFTAYIQIVATIVIAVILVIGINVIGLNYTFLSETAVSILTMSIMVGAVIVIYMKYIDMYSREVLDYDKLNMSMPTTGSGSGAIGNGAFGNIPQLTLQGIENGFVNGINGLSGTIGNELGFTSNNCRGQSCCANGTTWCDKAKMCVYSPDPEINVCDTAGLSDYNPQSCPIGNVAPSASPSTVGSSNVVNKPMSVTSSIGAGSGTGLQNLAQIVNSSGSSF